MAKKSVYSLNDKFHVFAENADGEAVGESLAGPFDTVELATAELAKLDKPTKAAKAADVTGEVAALKNQVNAIQNQMAANLKAAAAITDVQTPAEKVPFKSLGQAMTAIKEASRIGGDIHPRLSFLEAEYKAATGASEGSSSGGGFLLEPSITRDLLMPMTGLETSPFVSRSRKLPVGNNSNSGWVNGIDETSRVSTRWGGIVGYRLSEAAQKTASRPTFRRINWELKKYAVLMYATDELLADSAQLQSVFMAGVSEELAFMANDDVLNGTGASGPLGILNSTSLVTVAKEAGQAAATVLNANIVKMYQRLHPRFRANAVWFINSEVEPQLDQLSIPVGAAALEPRYVTYRPDGVMTIKGKPVVVTEFNAALGTVGDIVLANMQDYLYVEKSAENAASIHLRFDYDETVFRSVYRCYGLPASPAVTPYKGSNTQSAFVALATRS